MHGLRGLGAGWSGYVFSDMSTNALGLIMTSGSVPDWVELWSETKKERLVY